MHPVVMAKFQELIARYSPPGPDVLELGAVPATAEGFLEGLAGSNYTGVNMMLEHEGLGYSIVKANANSLSFSDESFDAVICNAMFEHDGHFWKSIAEARRVLRPGGIAYFGTPGFAERVGPAVRFATRVEAKLVHGSSNESLRRLGRSTTLGRMVSAATLPFHGAPSDYYRFSPAAHRDILLEGFEVLEVTTAHRPVRVISAGRKL